ncbi:MAG TPA: PAS domain S-box protein [Chitinophaga sp.]|uniref:PAS domain-containing sensor histidine kinase n=1 Tax=Chitinophaga sp. TaxID=1869181 RepID=UPI002F947F42
MSEYQQDISGNQLIQDDQARFFLASIIDTLQDSVVTISLEGIITSWNKSAERLYGYPATEAIGRSLHMVMFPKDFEPLRQSIDAIRAGQTVPVYHTLRLHKGGQNLELEITLSPVLDTELRVIGVSTVARDVTELNRAREALAASESRLRAIIEAAIDFAIITLDPQGIILDWSSGAEKMFGYSRQEAVGLHTEIIFTPEDRHGGIPMVEIEVARTTGRSVDERWHLHKEGARFFMSGVMTPLTEGPVNGYVKIARNITDRKMAEEALLLAEERKSLAVRSAEMGEWIWDIRADTVDISETVRLLFGLAADAEQVSPGLLFSLIYQPDQDTVRGQLNTALQGLMIFQAEYRIVRADNREIRWVNTYGRIIAQEGDHPTRMIGVIYDITSRKLLEKQKDDFISLASHELKTPVTGIKTYTEVLHEMLLESNAAESLIILNKINRQVDRLIKLLQMLLDSSTLSEGKMRLYPETFDLNSAISEQIEPFQRIAHSHRIRWEPAAIALVHADRDRIIQVVTNFVSNAIKYSPPEGEILISTEDKLEGVMVRVQDTGPGIPEEAQPYLFDRYYRVAGKAQKREGFGLGLYISAAIIHQHMGTIGVESVPGKGATFYFTLPYS